MFIYNGIYLPFSRTLSLCEAEFVFSEACYVGERASSESVYLVGPITMPITASTQMHTIIAHELSGLEPRQPPMTMKHCVPMAKAWCGEFPISVRHYRFGCNEFIY